MSDAVPVQLAEYSTMRAEICAFHGVEGQVVSVSVTLITALLGALTWALGNGSFKIGDDATFIHLVPLPFLALGLVFAYTQVRIIQAASYVQKHLRPRIAAAVGIGHDDVLMWEIFRRDRADCPVKALATALNSVRWLFFILPAMFPLTAWQRDLKSVGDFLLVIWDLTTLVVLIYLAIWTSIRLPHRVID